ncbi:MAG: sulfite exporter TauE/SafE family protein [Oscillospiraceae bacterium]|nr:sulfite exporter TauE/SafE family protein [Oscillospiraceae bacterium]
MPNVVTQLIVCFIAGIGAGLGTGFAGMSAAAVISPMLITFLNMDAYQAVGIALASDVLASAASAAEYGRNKNLDIRNGLIMMAAVLAFTVAGSWVSSLMPSTTMGNTSMFFTLFLGIKFIVRPVMTTRDAADGTDARTRALQSLASGAVVGFICGFIGAGGGMMLLLVLTTILHYDLKTAVGTSVFIMAFTALTGSVSHIVIGGMPEILPLVLCIVFTLLWAQIGARIANRARPITLNRITGAILIVLAVVILFVNFVLK